MALYKMGSARFVPARGLHGGHPVMRGTGPLFTVIGAWFLFGETFSGIQWLGVAVLLAGLYGLALYNMARITVARETLNPGALVRGADGAFRGALHHLRRLWHSRDGRSLYLPRVVLLHRRAALPVPCRGHSTDGSRTRPTLGPLAFRGTPPPPPPPPPTPPPPPPPTPHRRRAHSLRELTARSCWPRGSDQVGEAAVAARNLHGFRSADRLAVPQGTGRAGCARALMGLIAGGRGDS